MRAYALPVFELFMILITVFRSTAFVAIFPPSHSPLSTSSAARSGQPFEDANHGTTLAVALHSFFYRDTVFLSPRTFYTVHRPR